MNDTQQAGLAGRRVLVVEDEFYLANDLKRALDEQEAVILGPVATLARAQALIDEQTPDFAILDIHLRGEMIFPLADALRNRGVPFVFTTGYGATMVPSEYEDVERWEKPLAAQQVVAAIRKF